MSKEPEASILKILFQLWESGAQYLGLVVFAVVGGLMNYLGRVQRGEISFKILPLLAELSVSGFAGLLAALVATSMSFSTEMVYFFAGISGHLGARGIFLMQLVVAKKLNIDKEMK